MYGYPNTKLHEYDYIMVFDDDSGFLKPLPFDPVEVMERQVEDMGAYTVGQRGLKDGKITQRYLDTREGLWDFVDKFCKDNFIEPRCRDLWNYVFDCEKWEGGELYHFLDWSDTYVIKTRMYKTDLWAKWIKAVNESGGIYKHRWGDNEIMSLYHMIAYGLVYNLKIVEDGYFDQGLFRTCMAPSVKNNER